MYCRSGGPYLTVPLRFLESYVWVSRGETTGLLTYCTGTPTPLGYRKLNLNHISAGTTIENSCLLFVKKDTKTALNSRSVCGLRTDGHTQDPSCGVFFNDTAGVSRWVVVGLRNKAGFTLELSWDLHSFFAVTYPLQLQRTFYFAPNQTFCCQPHWDIFWNPTVLFGGKFGVKIFIEITCHVGPKY
jgi:hypothetical protein